MPRAKAASIAGSAEAGWTPIKAAVRTVPRRNRVEEQLPGDVFGRRCPARERHPSIPPQYPPRLGQRPNGIGHVVDPEIRDDSIECGVGKRQRFRIPLFKADLGMRGAGSPIIAAAKSSPV